MTKRKQCNSVLRHACSVPFPVCIQIGPNQVHGGSPSRAWSGNLVAMATLSRCCSKPFELHPCQAVTSGFLFFPAHFPWQNPGWRRLQCGPSLGEASRPAGCGLVQPCARIAFSSFQRRFRNGRGQAAETHPDGSFYEKMQIKSPAVGPYVPHNLQSHHFN